MNRETTLDAIETAISNITGIQTVVRIDKDFDLTAYATAALPLSVIYTPPATLQHASGSVLEETSDLRMELYWIDWDDDSETTEDWIETFIEGLNYLPNEQVLTYQRSQLRMIEDLEYPVKGFYINPQLLIYDGTVEGV